MQTNECKWTENRSEIAWGGIGGRQEGTFGVLAIFTVLIKVMVSQVWMYIKYIELYTLNICSIWYVNYNSITLFKKVVSMAVSSL